MKFEDASETDKQSVISTAHSSVYIYSLIQRESKDEKNPTYIISSLNMEIGISSRTIFVRPFMRS